MSRLRRTGLKIDDPLAPAGADPAERSRTNKNAEAAQPEPSIPDAMPPSNQGRRRVERAEPAPSKDSSTAAPLSVAWRSWSGATRVASYRLPDELLAEIATTATDLGLPVGLLVTAAIAHLLDEPADTIAALVDRADDARIQGRRRARRGSRRSARTTGSSSGTTGTL